MKLTIEIDLDRYGPTVKPDGTIVFKHRHALHNALTDVVDDIGAFRDDPYSPLERSATFEDFKQHFTCDEIDNGCSYNDVEETVVGNWTIN